MLRGLVCATLPLLSGTAFAYGQCCDYPGHHTRHSDRILAQASADLNNDAVADLAVAIKNGPIRLYLSGDDNGDTVSLANTADYTLTLTDTDATSLQFADVDGDQNLDLVASSSAGFDGKGAIEVFYGNGDGSLQTPSYRQVFNDGTPVDEVILLDVDGDGHRDAVAHQLNATNPLNPDDTVFRSGDGSGTFGGTRLDLPMHASLPGGGQTLPTRLFTADLNQDGRMDLVSLNERYLVWRLNSADGLLDPTDRQQFKLVQSTAYPPFLESADVGQLDSDGNLEIAVTSNAEERIYLLEFSGGTLQQESYSPIDNGPVTTPREVRITDLDDDGMDDLLVSTSKAPYNTAYYQRTGDGTFAPAQTTRAMAGRHLTLFGPQTLAISDISGSRDANAFRLLHLDQQGRLAPLDEPQRDSNDNPLSLHALSITDLNSDGNMDIALATEFRRLRALLGDGSGNFTLHAGGPVNLDLGGDVITSADFNLDGHPDVATAGRGGSCEVQLALGDSTGALAPQPSVPCSDQYPSASVHAIASADLDGSNGEDLVVLNDGTFEVLLNPGNGDFGSAGYQRAAASNNPENLLIADLDGQNGPDLIGTETFNEQINAYLNQGDGSFTAATVTRLVQNTDALDSGDFNSDGHADLVLLDYHGGSNGIRVLAGNGDGSFTTPPLITHPIAPESEDIHVFDYNQDGQPDVLVATGNDAGNQDAEEVLVLLENQGNQSLAVAGRFGYSNGTTGGLTRIASADLDNDNDADLLAIGSKGLRTYLKDGSGPASSNQAPTGEDAPLSVTAGLSVSEDLVALTSLTDADGDTLTLTASAVPAGLSVDANGILSGTAEATALANSPHALKLTASDGTASTTVTVDLSVTNQAPVASNLQPVSLGEEGSLNVDLGAGFTDPDGHTLTFSAQGLPGNLTLSSDGTLTGTVDAALLDNAPYTVTVTADDGFTTTDAAVSLTAGNEDSAAPTPVSDSSGGGAPSALWLLGLSGLLARRRGRLSQLLAGGSLLLTAPLAQALTFPAELHHISGSPNAMIHADVNGDGNQDIVTTGFSGSFSLVRVWLGDGQGGVAEPVRFTDNAGAGSRDLVSADLNNDGYDDLITANRDSDNLSIWLGSSDGNLSLAAGSPVSTTAPHGLSIIDANEDGQPDLVVGSYSNATPLKVFPGQGDGSFGTPGTLSISDYVRDTAVGDLDGDGHQDLVAGTTTNDIIPAFGDGTGQFVAPSTMDGAGGAPVALADLDGDGDSDILAGEDSAPALRVYRSQGNRTFDAAEQFESCGNAIGDSIVTGDVNRDGIPDVFATDGSMGGLGLWLTDSNGDLPEPQCPNAGGTTRDVTLADMDNDGRLDLIGLNQEQRGWVVHLNPADGSFNTPATLYNGPPMKPSFVAMADMNDDGREDLVTINTDLGDNDPGTTSIYLRQGDGQFATASHFDNLKDPRGLAVADMDGNGALDVITGSHEIGSSFSDFQVYNNDGAGTLTDGNDFGTDAGNVTDVAVSDFDLDGIKDIAMGNGGGNGDVTDQRVYVALGKDDGVYEYTVTENIVGPGPAQLDVGDMDEDGYPDLMVSSNGAGQLVWMENNGFGAFSSSATPALPGTVKDLKVLDLDADGHLDVAALTGDGSSTGNGYIHVIHGEGDGTFRTRQELDLARHLNASQHTELSEAQSLEAADLNGDGRIDLVATLGLDNRFVVLTQKSNGNFNPARSFLLQRIGKPADVTVGDLNGDSLPDLIIADPQQYYVSLITQLNPQASSSGDGGSVVGGSSGGGGALPGLYLLWLMVRRAKPARRL